MNIFHISLLAVILFAAGSCKGKKEDPVEAAKKQQEEYYRQNLLKVDSLKALVREGDIVTRTSNAWDSEQIKDFQQKDKTFTHAGIAVLHDGKIKICHVMGKDSVYKSDLTFYEQIDSFLNPRIYTAFGIFRFNLDSAQTRSMLAFADNCVQKKIPFDYLFETKTDDALTCTELVAKAVTSATKGTVKFTNTPITERRHVNLVKQYYRRYKPQDSDIIGRPIIAVDDITTNPAIKEIKRFFCIR